MIPDGRTPVVVVTGFLGSGKTTLVNHLVKAQTESLVIVNEYGDRAAEVSDPFGNHWYLATHLEAARST